VAAAREPALHARPRPVVGAALVTGAAALWATFGLFARHLYDAGFAPLELASVRAFVGFVGIALFALPRALRARSADAGARGASRRLLVPARDLGFLAAYGVFGFALFQYAFLAALDRTTVSIAVALLYTAPAFVVLASAALFRERIGTVRWLALGIALGGVVLVTGAVRALLAGTASLSVSAFTVGLASGVTYALYTMFSKVGTERYGAEAALFWSFLFATAALAVVASPLAPLLREARHLPALIGLGIVPTLIPYALYLMGLRLLRASTAAMLACTEPAIATLLAALVLQERFDALQALGIGLIVLAALLLAGEAE
jgi:drug/metabolite transporter (DMT)-like permease